jgi:hypothetical protein
MTSARPLLPRRHPEDNEPTDPAIHPWGRRAADFEAVPKPAPWAAIVVSVLALAGSIFLFGLHQESRMSRLEEGLIQEHNINAAQDVDTKEFRKEWSSMLMDIRERQIRIEDRQVKSIGGR